MDRRAPHSNAQPTSFIEHLLCIQPIDVHGEDSSVDTFTHTCPLRRPPWARGAYGGHVLALALLAAYNTVSEDLRIHSCHCEFLHAASVDLRVTYTVHRSRDSQKFASRRVEAKQLDKAIFTATASFVRRRSITRRQVLQHAVPAPAAVRSSPPKIVDQSFATQSAAGQAGPDQPCDCIRVPASWQDRSSRHPSDRKFVQWIRARGSITGGECMHLAALAYMTDNYFIGTVFRAHNATRFSATSPQRLQTTGNPQEMQDLESYLQALEDEEIAEEARTAAPSRQSRKQVDWLVTLDHTIYFHDVEDLRADEWMLAEMDSPWANDERGLVMQKIWSHKGTLLATCVQQGVVRLQQQGGDEKL